MAAVVSLVSEFYPLDGIGKFGGNFGKWETERCEEPLETRNLRRALKFLAPVFPRLNPRARGRGGFVSLGIISAIEYW